ncbi:MAG: hypothetical protein JXA42_14205 [Anaerolineales bacterium]|nr:hypothetical protein [Anaerolineales bacterium]
MQRYRRFTGEGLSFGIERGSIGNFLSRRGFINIVAVDSNRLEASYCTGINKERSVGNVYAIVCAEVGKKINP